MNNSTTPKKPSNLSTKREITRRNIIKETSTPAGLITADQSEITIQRVEEVSGELLKHPHKEKDIIYTGWEPLVINIHSNIFPRYMQRFFARKIFRLRGYFNKAHEPMTRNPFTGEILDPIKKNKVLLERNVIDSDGFLLDTEGKRIIRDDCWVKVDVSDIDFIKAEVYSLKQSEMVIEVAKGMKRTGSQMEDMWKWIMIAFIAGFVGIVFIMNGGG